MNSVGHIFLEAEFILPNKLMECDLALVLVCRLMVSMLRQE